MFFVQDGTLTFLIRDERPRTTETIVHGEYFGAQVVDGRIVRS
jgi:hypothetical protein